MNVRKKAADTADFLKQRWKAAPQVGMLTGTGLGHTAEMVEGSIILDYSEVPHFPVSTVQSHAGKLVFGRLAGKQIVTLQGRFHLYEGYSAEAVSFPIRVMQELGVEAVILTNASGGLNPDFTDGDIMIITDHINLTGENPLVGPAQDQWGDRFPDMSAAYDGRMISLAVDAGQHHGVLLQQGIYAGLKGPSLETPAEVRFLQTIGAHAVGFSTVMEVIAAVQANIPVLGLSIITNVHKPAAPVPASVEDIIQTANRCGPLLGKIISHVIANI